MYELELLEQRRLLSGFLVGDANHDGVVNAADAAAIAAHVVHLEKTTPADLKRLDLSGDGRLTGFDVSLALALAQGQPVVFGGVTLYPSRNYLKGN